MSVHDASRVGADRIGSGSDLNTTTTPAEGHGGGGVEMRELEGELQRRGVQTPLPALLSTASVGAIRRSIEWWDRQAGAGQGVLVDVIRKGGIAELPESKSMQERERRYGLQIESWLRTHFPEFTDPVWGPHPAAIVAVIHLHHRHGKGRITKREHGAEIRAAVAEWNRKWGQAA